MSRGEGATYDMYDNFTGYDIEDTNMAGLQCAEYG